MDPLEPGRGQCSERAAQRWAWVDGLDLCQRRGGNHDTLSKAFTATQIETAFDKQAKRAKSGMSGRLSLRKEVEEARNKSTAVELEMLLVICIDVVAADGDVGAKEMTQLKTIGQAVGLDPARYLA